MAGLDEPVTIEAKHLQEVGGGRAQLATTAPPRPPCHLCRSQREIPRSGAQPDRLRRAAPPAAPSNSR